MTAYRTLTDAGYGNRGPQRERAFGRNEAQTFAKPAAVPRPEVEQIEGGNGFVIDFAID